MVPAEALLENYSAALTPGTTPASELGAYLSLSSTKTLELAQAKTKTEDEIEELEAELSKLQDGEKDETEGNGKTSEAKLKRTADELRGQRRRTIRVLVEVEGGEVAENKTEDRVVNILLVYGQSGVPQSRRSRARQSLMLTGDADADSHPRSSMVTTVRHPSQNVACYFTNRREGPAGSCDIAAPEGAPRRKSHLSQCLFPTPTAYDI